MGSPKRFNFSPHSLLQPDQFKGGNSRKGKALLLKDSSWQQTFIAITGPFQNYSVTSNLRLAAYFAHLAKILKIFLFERQISEQFDFNTLFLLFYKVNCKESFSY